MSTDVLTSAPPANGATPRPARPRGRVQGGWVLMVVAGLMAAAANLAVLTDRGPEATTVLVLAADAPPGTPVGQLALRPGQVIAEDDLVGTLVRPEQLAELSEAVTGRRVVAGDLLLGSHLRRDANTTGRAMSLPIEAARAAGGMIAPGDLVDVLADLGEEGPTDGVAPSVQAILEAVEVLAVGDGGAGLGGTGLLSVTLAVTPEQALSLATALRGADIDLVRVGRAA